MTAWQPIETAPKDGTRILLYREGRVVCGGWDDEKYAKNPRPYWTCDLVHLWGKRDARELPPSHWMAIPASPVPK